MSKFTKADKLMLQVLRLERGCRDEITGKVDPKVGVFHILSKATHPRLRYCKRNLLLVSWYPTHNDWHHNYFKAQIIEKRIKALLGTNYKYDLEVINRTMPKVDIKLTELVLKQELENLKSNDKI